ncbi:D-alanyl-D-alanine carboxypeptidase family protein [Microvirga sp. CF3016]|uniref:D-alanyl-D-alanine carboxypeptidase family protein n=1 Tax=Microvirga sp. CF3016 TaxID=3110181 RepID=UPI002E78635C|nr:D-alanyl-D-alanine carboxypeptidase family protein [Microvirga sp. CF3016]MEE1610402.1 D-alanyl-D-alanine carboxypeptidase family protein [Microvirga sp. CF3016]
MKPLSILLAAGLLLTPLSAGASPMLLVDASTGDVLAAQEATRSWHPASLTKMMTAHLALTAVRSGQVSMDTSVVLSPKAAAQPPSKLGVPPGTSLRLEDALTVIMVRSANDVSVAIAEAIGGSEEAFVAAMNAEARRLGMTGTRFVNPTGLHDDRQVTNARDMAVLMLVLLSYHADYMDLLRTPSVTVNGRLLKNTNKLVDEYAGLEASKTGFVCASGFNVAVSALRGNRRVIGVVLGSPSAATRTLVMRELLNTGLVETASPVGNLRTMRAAGPAPAADLRRLKCGRQDPARLEAKAAGTGTKRTEVQSLR